MFKWSFDEDCQQSALEDKSVIMDALMLLNYGA
jgi:hypothetical protein